uniref:Capsid protein n=1 Tax=Red panda feces-associated circular DNA virus 15 TaxID=2863968 RepID=A0A8K1M4J1_9VIRU|nr:capsid protein [Red panda feces-associated circular DNA virus 15]
MSAKKPITYTKTVTTSRRPSARKLSYRRPAYRKSYRKTNYKRRYYNGGIARTVGSMGGSILGGYLGGPAGAVLGSRVGSKAGDLFSSITGMGDYKVSYNTVVNPQQTPMFKNKGRSVFISHREYIQDVVTSATPGAFDIDSFEINPALSSTFPWLATIAQNFEQYRIHGMVFHFKSNSADALNSVNTALGTVILATQYNVLLPLFKNKQEMENYEFGCSTRPSSDVLHPVECDPKVTSFGPVFDVKLGGNDSGDNRLYCPGRFSIATVGQQGTSVNIGELWVTYDIEFFKPRMGDVASMISQFKATGTFTAAQPFGTVPLIPSESSDFSAVSITPTTIFFDKSFTGKVQVSVDWNGVLTAGLSGPASATPVGGVNLFRVLRDNQGATIGLPPMGSSSTTTVYWTCFLDIVNGGSLVLNGGVYTGMTSVDVIVTTLPSTFEQYEEEDDFVLP